MKFPLQFSHIAKMLWLAIVIALTATLSPARPALAVCDPDATITRVSVASDGTQADISPDGRWIVFASSASNIVENDTNDVADIFMFDRQTEQITRISVASDGSQADDRSMGMLGNKISQDGRFVLFTSWASNLVANDTNNAEDAFVRDVQLGQTIRVSVASDGSQANAGSYSNAFSQDGRYIVFRSIGSNLVNDDSNNVPDIFIRDLQTGETSRISLATDGTQANQPSENATISADGRYVAFGSQASNLVSGDTNNISDTFLHDRITAQTFRVSIASDGTEANGNYAGYVPQISTNGRYTIFTSDASNLVDGDTNNTVDVFRYDRLTGQTKLISHDGNGGQGNGHSGLTDISDDGSFVVFSSSSSNLVSGDTNGIYDVFVTGVSQSTTLTVTSTNDLNDGTCNTAHCALREAIDIANTTVDLDTINFNIPGAGVHTIQPATPLPLITNPVIIDGTTQPGYAVGAPVIVLNGTSAVSSYVPPAPLIDLVGINIFGASNSTVRGLVINGWGYGGVGILNGNNNVIEGNFIGTNVGGTTAVPNLYGVIIYNGSNNRVGGTTPAQRNVISGNNDDGVNIGGQTSAQAIGNLVQGNYIGTTVNGSAALGNGDDGVKVEIADGTIIGGTMASARNIIAASDNNGVILKGENTVNSLVQGNYIGTDVTGTVALGNNQDGVRIEDAPNNLVGGTVSEARNVISGNQFGIFIVGVTATGNDVQGNYIGTNAAGSSALAPSAAQSAGVVLAANNNVLGGTTSGARNTISGNVEGVGILGDNNIVQGNYIGTDATGTLDVGNTAWGIEMVDVTANNLIGGTLPGAGNTIAYNNSTGIWIYNSSASIGNAILGNSIFSNGSLGIELSLNCCTTGVTPNDPGDGDTGPNNLQNFPVLTSANPTTNGTAILGTLNSEANKTYRLEFFSNPTCDPSGNGEGQTYLGFTNVTTNGSGDIAFTANLSIVVPAGQFITATATDPDNNTSEFSACVPVVVISLPAAAPAQNYFVTNTVPLTWSAVSWAVGYEIEVDNSATFAAPFVYTNRSLDVGTPSDIANLPFGDGVYYWRVGAKKPGGGIVWSAPQSFTVDVPLP